MNATNFLSKLITIVSTALDSDPFLGKELETLKLKRHLMVQSWNVLNVGNE